MENGNEINQAWGGSSLCNGWHVFTFAGSISDGKISEGYPCACGLTRAHYVKCDKCGLEHMEAIPNE